MLAKKRVGHKDLASVQQKARELKIRLAKRPVKCSKIQRKKCYLIHKDIDKQKKALPVRKTTKKLIKAVQKHFSKKL